MDQCNLDLSANWCTGENVFNTLFGKSLAEVMRTANRLNDRGMHEQVREIAEVMTYRSIITRFNYKISVDYRSIKRMNVTLRDFAADLRANPDYRFRLIDEDRSGSWEIYERSSSLDTSSLDMSFLRPAQRPLECLRPSCEPSRRHSCLMSCQVLTSILILSGAFLLMIMFMLHVFRPGDRSSSEHYY